MLRVSIIGNLGGDPEMRYLQSGEQLVNLSIAVNQRKRVPDSDEWKESTNWFRIRCSGWRAELAQKLSKGQRVFACGRMEINEYVRRDGTPGVAHDIWADELRDIGAPRSDSANGSAQRAPAAAAATATAQSDEDLPF